MQTFGVPPQIPFASHWSVDVQSVPSLQGVLGASLVYSQAPEAGLHVPAAW